MTTLIITLAAFFASLLTFFSGFGLGTLLMPVIAIFFPLPVAIAATAIVHFLNNFFKIILLRNKANWGVTIKFGIPAILAAILGAWLLKTVALFPTLYSYTLFSISAKIEVIKIIIGLLTILFASLEWVSLKSGLVIHQRWLPMGGVLSGFFGGLSGHQGAFRAPFLLHANLTHEQYVGTNASIAVLVDITRLLVYGFSFNQTLFAHVSASLLSITVISAFLGATLGFLSLKKVTNSLIKRLVIALLYSLGFCFISGIL